MNRYEPRIPQRLKPWEYVKLQHISALGERWAIGTNRRPFYNYCVNEGNDTDEDADRLVELFSPEVWETTLSVICEKTESVKASIDR